jgi:hypothetical protein
VLLAVGLVAAAALHVYWAAGGNWFLSTALNMPLEDVGTSIRLVTWALVLVLLGASVVVLCRAEVVNCPLPDRLIALASWAFTAVMFAGAAYNATIDRVWDRWVFGPIFLVTGLLALAVSLPGRREGRDAP